MLAAEVVYLPKETLRDGLEVSSSLPTMLHLTCCACRQACGGADLHPCGELALGCPDYGLPAHLPQQHCHWQRLW